jgi:hypothetical protein
LQPGSGTKPSQGQGDLCGVLAACLELSGNCCPCFLLVWLLPGSCLSGLDLPVADLPEAPDRPAPHYILAVARRVCPTTHCTQADAVLPECSKRPSPQSCSHKAEAFETRVKSPVGLSSTFGPEVSRHCEQQSSGAFKEVVEPAGETHILPAQCLQHGQRQGKGHLQPGGLLKQHRQAGGPFAGRSISRLRRIRRV